MFFSTSCGNTNKNANRVDHYPQTTESSNNEATESQPRNSEYSLVSELYFLSMQTPEKADQIIQRNQDLFDSQFFGCLANVRQMVGVQGTNWGKYCDAIPYDMQSDCRQQNWALALYLWTVSIEEAIVDGIPWRNTLVGSLAFEGQRQMKDMRVYMPNILQLNEKINRIRAQSLVCY